MGATQEVGRGVGALEAEHEVVVEIARHRVEEGVKHLGLLGAPGKVDVLGRPRAVSQSEVEREPALDDPGAGCGRDEAREQAVAPRLRLEAVLERAAEGCRGRVSHGPT